MEVILKVTGIVGTIISILLFYRVIYAVIGILKKKKYKKAKIQHNYGILIAGRNEANVIGQLIDSLKASSYDMSKIRIFVCADNCKDDTAKIAREHGAVAFERFNKKEVGKGFALDFLLKNIHKYDPKYFPEGWFIFDADNLVDKDYISKMNDAFDAGEEIILGFRNGKNYDTNWVSAVNCLDHMHNCRLGHSPRTVLNLSTNCTGTGVLVKSNLINYEIGYKWHGISCDFDVSLEYLLKGHKTVYQDEAVFYDEQPTNLKTVYKQRYRWARGTYYYFNKYGWAYFKKIFTGKSFAFYDMFMMIFPLGFLSGLLFIFNITYPIISGLVGICTGGGSCKPVNYALN